MSKQKRDLEHKESERETKKHESEDHHSHHSHHHHHKHNDKPENKNAKSVWEEFINSTQVKDVLFSVQKSEGKKKLITLDPDASLLDALKALRENDILSAPILVPESNQLLGFVDVLDIATYVLEAWHKNSKIPLSSFKRDKNYSNDVFFEAKVKDIRNLSGVDPTVTIEEEDNLRKVFQLFGEPTRHQRLHRLAVLKAGKLVAVLSQRDILSYFKLKPETLPAGLGEESLEGLHLIHRPLLLRVDSPFDEALEFLRQNRVSGIALVDEQSRISGHFSASDLRGLQQEAFRYFTGSVIQFLVKGTETHMAAPVSCPPTTSVNDCIALMLDNKSRLVFTTDNSGHLTGVVSMSDIISILSLIH